MSTAPPDCAVLLVQRFAGIDGFGAYLDGAKKTELSRTGNKFRFGPGLCERFRMPRAPVWRSWVNDLDGCALTLSILRRCPELREAVARRVWAMVPCSACRAEDVARALAGELRPKPADLIGTAGCVECSGTGVQDARRLWDRLQREPVPEGFIERGAVYLCLQNGARSGQPVVPWPNGPSAWGMLREARPNAISTYCGDDGLRKGTPERTQPLPFTLPPRIETAASSTTVLVSQSHVDAVLPAAAAAWLYLQARATNTKPVTVVDDRYKVPGYKPEWYGGPDDKPNGHGYDRPRWTIAEALSAEAAATWLFMQSRAYSGSAIVAGVNGEWQMQKGAAMGRPSFSPEYGRIEAEDRSRFVSPRWTLANAAGTGMSASISRLPAADVLPPYPLPTHDENGRHVVVVLYDDPPFKGQHEKRKSTGYSFENDRAAMWEGARSWRDACRDVGIEFRYGLSEMEDCAKEVKSELQLDVTAAPLASARKSTFWSKEAKASKGKMGEWLMTATEGA